ncbi:type VI secretion system tip protein VgrG, partial [Escherichia coli]|uniref:type VI secretion system tip protein VgrG n=19 Tax=Escherichia coli TaxID=562 RepID=UPI001CC4FE22
MNVQFFDHAHHKLKIRGLQSPVDVLTFEGREQLSTPFRYDIQFTSSDKAIAPESVLMQDGAFSLTAPPVQGMPVQTALRTLHGVITGFKHLSSSQDEARYEVRLEPRMALLTRSRQNAIYQNQTVPQIVEKILRERHQMRGQDFVFNLKSEYPAREQVMQYGEDDLTFVSRLLSEVGIWFRFATDARLKIEVIEFYDDQSGYERGLTLPLRHPSGLFDGETEAVWGLNTAYSVVEKSVSTRDYNYREATAEMTTGQHDATGGDNTTYGEAYHYADNFLQQGDKEAAESGAFYARIRHERYLNEQAILKGQSTSSLLMPGLEIRVQGDDAPAVFRKGVLITGVTASAARDRSYELTFTAIPYSERYGYRPALIPRPVMAGTLPARVTSTVKNDIYAHIDKDGRYRVNLDFDRDTWKPGYESLWVRQSRPYAGDTYGLHLPLLAGTEVSIAFEEGNPDRPYIAGVKHDSAHTDHVTIQNYKRNVLRTPANNKIRLDDERGKEHIKVSTEYGGKSQLNLGHLVDAGKQQRGEGFELRTDLWGAVRAKKGIFISADAQDKAQGQVREMADIISELNGLSDKIQKLSDDATTANADPADMAAQIALITSRINIDKDGRYRVNLDFDRDTWKPGYESLWVRQSRPYAGDTYGLHLPLLAGTEVSIAFEEGNPDRPYIAGVKHDSAHTDHVTIQNYKRNVLRTPANNKIRLDDERGKEHIKVSTEYGGKSQLNLGHLVDAGKQQRGEGFELRTDMWGAVRAKKGIFISADTQDKAQGQVREMAPAMAILDGAQSQMKSLSTDAQTANADPADLSSQIALLQQSVKDLTQAAILLSAPKGVAIASGEHLQLAASKNLIANAGNHADIGVVKNMFIGVGQALSVFVRKAGIKLFANKGAISVQAQNDLMELLAQKSIVITSTEDEIKITAKKKITLNGGGSYIRLDACGIEAGTPGEYNVKA